MRLALPVCLFLAAGPAFASTVDPLLKDFRIALRYSPDRILLIGGEIQDHMDPGEVRTVNEESPPDPNFMRNRPRVATVDDLHVSSTDGLKRFHFAPETPWKPDDRWVLYTGATKPVILIIEQVGFGFYCGGPGGWAIAVARYESPSSARLVAGLHAEAYLATPGPVNETVSATPMVGLRGGPLYEATSVLLLRNARTILSKTLNRQGKLTAYRWSPPRGRAIIFAEERWFDLQHRDLVVASGILEDRRPLSILQAGAGKAEQESKEMPEPFGWLNVWEIGGRRFVLTYWRGGESYGISLHEIVPGKGTVETGLSCMEGC